MDASGGDNVINLKASKLSIKEMLGGAPGRRPQQPPEQHKEVPVPPDLPGFLPEADGLDLALPEVLDPLPLAGDSYKASSRAANKPLLTVYFLLKDSSVRGFAYQTFDSIDRLPSATPGGGPVVVARFAGLNPSEVRLEGRDLGTLMDHIGQHRILWVRERGQRAFGEDSGTVVTAITITPLE